MITTGIPASSLMHSLKKALYWRMLLPITLDSPLSYVYYDIPIPVVIYLDAHSSIDFSLWLCLVESNTERVSKLFDKEEDRMKKTKGSSYGDGKVRICHFYPENRGPLKTCPCSEINSKQEEVRQE